MTESHICHGSLKQLFSHLMQLWQLEHKVWQQNQIGVLLVSTSGEPSVNRKYLQALALAGPTMKNPVPDPLAVLHLDNNVHRAST